ncbi:MAG TPA: DUF1707 domain-containing protein [Mycobacterium sp.]|nr:DUF1707 domain-containing protein [Mycobacterium sp.]HTX97816.1 DUF1707 domain-containing protein [Mycobacterium sp.]
MIQPGSRYGDSTRANDLDRADVCAILDNAYADGELDAEEHRQRCAWAMSAKTRGQLLGMISDLQARPPVFSQQSAIAPKVNPNRKWLIGAGVGASVAAVAILGALVATWHSGSRPSPTAPVAAPAAPVAAPPQSPSSESTRPFLAIADLVSMISGDFQDQTGHAPERVSCPGDLDGHVGAFERCSIADNGKRYTADVTVTAVNGGQVSSRDTISEVGSPPPAPPSRP